MWTPDFCTVCDKQCPVGSSVYCSESCRSREFLKSSVESLSTSSREMLMFNYSNSSTSSNLSTTGGRNSDPSSRRSSCEYSLDYRPAARNSVSYFSEDEDFNGLPLMSTTTATNATSYMTPKVMKSGCSGSSPNSQLSSLADATSSSYRKWLANSHIHW